MKRLLGLVAGVLAAALWPAHAEGPDDQYVRIYLLIQQADTLSGSAEPAAALAKYLEAQSELQRFQKIYPDWNTKIINFRLNYLASQIAVLTPKGPAPVAPASTASGPPATAPPARTTVSPDLENQVSGLREQVRQLQADKERLELKLKEALATQPATVDPRELARAQEKIQSLLKENELLKTAVAAPPAAASTAAAKDLADARAALSEANRKLTEQTERARALAAEKQALQQQLDRRATGAENAAELARLKQARDQAERKLADQTAQAARLAAENEALQARVQTLAAGAAAAEALRAENELLKQQAAGAAAGGSAELSRQLAQAQARIAALQSDAEILRLEKQALENRVKTAAARPATPAASRPEDLQRIKLLEADRYDLATKLDAANKELYGRKGGAVAAKVQELTGEINTLRARLQVYEARAVPYTAEELALFKPSPPRLAAADPRAGKKSVRELPPGTAALVAEAQRDFAAKRFDQAQEKYLEVLRRDEHNALTLANLAAIELELNQLDQADQHIQKALATAPNDAYNLSILGYVRYRQERYDEALDALSKAATLDPQNAEVQNYLGVTLGHKGLRGPAETALRKAIQLDPGYGAAHHNLAVIYATQKPPLIELARWHYQRARAAGQPHDPELEKLFDQKPGAPANRK
jgi:tetratricopeptide (TPR) repeat protein